MIAEYKTVLPDKKMIQAKLHESTRYLLHLRIDWEKKSPNNFQLCVFSDVGTDSVNTPFSIAEILTLNYTDCPNCTL